MRITTIVGARPQIIKAAAVSRVLRRTHTEILIHTGQHYDRVMSAIFFDELNIPRPDVNLGVGGGTHGEQTSGMLRGIEDVLINEKPDWCLVYGDTNSTLAGALAASKLCIPVAHIEAGLRSFNRAMPEEINRVITDHVASLLLCPSQTAVENLANEGICQHVYNVGDVMADVLLYAVEQANCHAGVLGRLGLVEKGYILATVHRAENTDNRDRLQAILKAFATLDSPLLFIAHPRTQRMLDEIGYQPAPNVLVVEPVGYLEMVILERSARLILTDSGGIQKEAYWLKVPCITLRDETEWIETVKAGWNIIAGAVTERIVQATRQFDIPSDHPPLYGDGHAAELCVKALTEPDIHLA